MKTTKKDLDKNQVEFTIEVSVKEIEPFLKKAAKKLSQNAKIAGFRPGKAPYDMVVKELGEMTVLQEALDPIVTQTFYDAVKKEKLETVGRPDIKIEKVAPGNDLVYIAKVALLPKVTLGDWKKLSVKKKAAKATEEEIKKTLDQLTEMQVKETAVDRAAKKGDKVELDFEVYMNKAIIEGGKNSKYPLVIGDGKMIPGFEDKMIGTRAGDKKEFELKFPDKYFQENLAGKMAEFKVKVLSVFEREIPKVDDALAKNLGFDTAAKLKKQLTENIEKDKETKEKQRAEGEAIQEILKQATIGDIPDSLKENEVHKMIHELEHSITQQGMKMDDYLQSIKKTHDDLHKDFGPQAEERVKAALIMREIAMAEKIKIDDKKIDEELKKQEEMYKDNKDAMQNIKHPAYREHLANLMANQAVVDLINKTIIK